MRSAEIIDKVEKKNKEKNIKKNKEYKDKILIGIHGLIIILFLTVLIFTYLSDYNSFEFIYCSIVIILLAPPSIWIFFSGLIELKKEIKTNKKKYNTNEESKKVWKRSF